MTTRLYAMLLAVCSISAADSFSDEHSALRSANLPGLRFEARFAEPRTSYRIGERITVTLAFASDRSETYRVNGARYDRSGRLHVDRFVVDRSAEASDPLEWYYGSGVAGGSAGGLRGYPTLGIEPVEIEADLDEWIRFARPGRYRVFVVSKRVGLVDPTEGQAGPRLAASGMLHLEILPRDEQADAVVMAAATAALAKAAAYDDPWPLPRPLPQELDEQVRGAVKALRYLGTATAVDALLDAHGIARGQYDGAITLALAASGQRSYLRARLLRYLEDPRYSLPGSLFHLLLVNEIASEFPSTLPWAPAEVDEAAIAEARMRQGRREEIATDFARLLARLAPTKTPAARKADFRIIERYLPEEAKALRPLVEDPAPTPAEFLALSTEEQTGWLYGRRWERLRGPDILPALLEVLPALRAKPSLDPTALRKTLAWSAMLERVAELDPAKGRSLVLADLMQELSMASLRLLARVLPDGVYPEIDEPTMARLERRATSRDSAVLARYASSAVSDRALAIYRSVSPAPCNLEQSLLAYLVRVRPAEGATLVEKALGSRENRGCWRRLLTSIGRVAWSPQLEALALRQLDDPSPEAALDAARALVRHESDTTRGSIWTRLEREADSSMRNALHRALRCAPGRLWSESDQVRWRKICTECEPRQSVGPVPLTLETSTAMDRGWTILLDGCDLRSPAALSQRLRLYARGSVVEWNSPGSMESGEAAAVFERIRVEVEDQGVTLRRGGEGP